MELALFVIAPIIFISFLVAGIFLIVSKKNPLAGRIILSLLTAAAGCIVYFIAFLIVAITSKDAVFYTLIIADITLLCIVSVICGLFGVLFRKPVFIPLMSLMLISFGVLAGRFSYNVYTDHLPTLSEADSLLMQYDPYMNGSKAVDLAGPSLLTFDADTDDMPVLDGATALFPIYASFAKAVYPREAIDSSAATNDENYTDHLVCSKTTGAYESIVTGGADMIFVAAPSDKQKEYAAENGVELVYTPIGREAFVFFVNCKNPVDDISLDNIRGIYSGRITSWDELGVNHMGDIKAFQRSEGSGSQSALIRLMGDEPIKEPETEDVFSAMEGIITQTADYKNYKNAIGYSFRFYSTEMVNNKQIKLLKINGVYPDIESIENGTYPITSEFYAVTRSDASENTKRLLAWIQSRQGQEIIKNVGYTPISKDGI